MRMDPQRVIYKPLPYGQWFRLLRVLPGIPDDAIQCELLVSKIDDLPNYEPVSYAWGDPTTRKQIICDGVPVSVTTSAYQLLRRFRKRCKERIIWLDGICIDQTNNKEKNHQVAFMSHIYSHGSQTLVWLGEVGDRNNYEHDNCQKTHRDCVESALQLVKSVNNFFEHEFEKRQEDDGEVDVWSRIDEIASMPTTKDWIARTEHWECVRHFFTRPYFSRCWVLGEVGISTRVEAFCGIFSLQWSEIVLFTQLLSSTMTQIMQHVLPVAQFTGIFDYMWVFMAKENSWINERRILEETGKSSKHLYAIPGNSLALRVLNSSRGFNATDARDHLFAFLGHPALESIITPDYSSSLEDTHLAFGVSLVKSSGSLDLLCFVDNNEADLHSSLPSWVPQWHRPVIHRKEIHPYWQWLKQDSVEPVISLCDRSLAVNALILDNISTYSSRIESEEFEKVVTDASTDRHTQHIIEKLWEMYMDGRTSQTGDSLRVGKAFVWTLVFGSYTRQDWLVVDFLAYCNTHCSEKFYTDLLQIPFFATAFEDNNSALNTDDGGQFVSWARDAVNCKFFITGTGRCGYGPGILEKDDVITVIFGCRMPVVLRPTGITGCFKLVGNCFVAELMAEGEINFAANEWKAGLRKEQKITLI
ncbi:heterokaryon incompatibility protein-domain-containing protein [Xylaria arbuscula]|nr:heterokaryon incompatibility protein-domain-containing protein [Xylaria arbuscula]